MINATEANILPPTSLIIPTRNRPTMLRETIASILQGHEAPSEIVVIDQSAEPDPAFASCNPMRACEIRYFHVNATGLSRARNEGINQARYEILAFIDDDMYVAQDWYSNFIRALLHAGPGAVVTGRVLAYQEKNTRGFVPSLAISDKAQTYHGRQPMDVLAGGHMVTTRAVFNRVGCFDERLGAGSKFPSSEDNDWGFRLLEEGGTIVYAPEAVIYHRAWRPPRDYYTMRWSYGRGQGAYYAKYFSLQDTHMVSRMFQDARYRVRRFPVRCIRDPHGAAGDAIFILAMLTGAVEWLLTQPKEKEIQLCRSKEINV